MERDDLVKFHDRYFSPDNATLAVVGDVRTDDVMAAVAKAFETWKVAATDSAAEKGQPTFPDPPKGITVNLVDRPGSVQSSVLVCRRGVARNAPDVPEIGVLNAILGGGASGRSVPEPARAARIHLRVEFEFFHEPLRRPVLGERRGA